MLHARPSILAGVVLPLGAEEKPFVASGNKMLSRLALVLQYLNWRCCRWVVEQPLSSLAFYHPRLEHLARTDPA